MLRPSRRDPVRPSAEFPFRLDAAADPAGGRRRESAPTVGRDEEVATQLNGVEITWLGHATFRLRLGDGTTIFLDPWLEGNPSCPESEHSQDRVDAVYVSHGHFDHVLGVEPLTAGTAAPVHAIFEIAAWAEGRGLNAVGLNKGGTVEGPGGVRATLVDAVHSSGLPGDGGILPGGDPGGWILDVPGGPVLYFAGDTMPFGDMRLIRELWSPSIAFLPIGGWFTMDPRQAAVAATMLGVEAVIPMHFGTCPVLVGTPAELEDHAAGRFEVASPRIGEPVT